jgi:hypothetical protein
MNTRSIRMMCVALATLCIASGAATAQGRGHGHNKVPPGLAKKGGLPPGQAKKIYRADDGVNVLRDIFGQHGYTVVRTAGSGDARYVYYRMRDGATRRAIVTPGPDRLSFRNVPDALVREALARLY